MAKIPMQTDDGDLAAILEDVRECLLFIRQAQGYGEIVVRIQVRPGGFAGWEVAPSFTRKPRARGVVLEEARVS